MMKKLHPGHYVAIFLVFFITLLVTALIASRNQDHNLVSENYYDLDLQYQQRMIAKNNIARNPDKVTLSQNDDKVIFLTFNNHYHDRKGIIKMYRPSDPTMDITMPLIINENKKLSIPIAKLAKGRWVLILDWSENDTAYYKEFNLYL